VGLGTGEQDREVANAALAAIPGARLGGARRDRVRLMARGVSD